MSFGKKGKKDKAINAQQQAIWNAPPNSHDPSNMQAPPMGAQPFNAQPPFNMQPPPMSTQPPYNMQAPPMGAQPPQNMQVPPMGMGAQPPSNMQAQPFNAQPQHNMNVPPFNAPSEYNTNEPYYNPPQNVYDPPHKTHSQQSSVWINLLVKYEGNESTRVMTTFPFIVGRDHVAGGIQVEDRNVSRLHCEIDLKHYGFTITDINSSNGSEVSGERLQPGIAKELKVGDVIKIGRTEIQVVGTSDVSSDFDRTVYMDYEDKTEYMPLSSRFGQQNQIAPPDAPVTAWIHNEYAQESDWAPEQNPQISTEFPNQEASGHGFQEQQERSPIEPAYQPQQDHFKEEPAYQQQQERSPIEPAHQQQQEFMQRDSDYRQQRNPTFNPSPLQILQPLSSGSFCSNCGQYNPEHNVFCTKCGNRIG